MSDIIQKIIKTLERSKKVIEEVLKDNTDEVEKLIREQLRHGIDGTGNNIRPKYSGKYGQFKLTLSSYGLDGSTPDLFVSGDFYKSIKAKYYKNDTIFVDSKVSYYLHLHNSYGADILNLAPVSLASYSLLLYNKILKKEKQIWK